MRIIIEDDDFEYPIVYSNVDDENIKLIDKLLYQIANNPLNNIERDWLLKYNQK